MSNIDVCILPCWNCHDLDFVQAYFKCKRLCLQLNFSNVFLKIWMKWHISQFPTVLKMDIFILFANFGLHLLFVHLSTGNLRKKRIKTNWKKIVDNENPWLLDWFHELVSRVHFLKKVTTFSFFQIHSLKDSPLRNGLKCLIMLNFTIQVNFKSPVW